MKGLTDRQAEFLAFIEDYIAQNGFAPTLRELAMRFSVSAEAARRQLEALERKGAIRRLPGAGRGTSLSAREAGRREKLPVPLYPKEPTEEDLDCKRKPEGRAYLERFLAAEGTFAFIVRSESMREAGILPGDIAYLSGDLGGLKDGMIVLAPADEMGNLELLRYRKLPYYIELSPENVTMGIRKATQPRLSGLLIKTERFYN